jgi:APA family basic amino acid/polyamine antiporter
MSSFGIALVAALWAFKGWEAATYSAGETKNPQRNLPLGIFVGILACIVIYILAQLAYLYVIPAGEIAKSDRIAADAMALVIGPIGASIISFIILFSIMGATNQNFLCSPRVYYAMAKDRIFFKQLSAVHPRFRTPHVAIIAMGVWSMILVLFFGTFENLLNYFIFGQWIFFGLTVAAVFILRKKRPDLPRPYKTWGYPVTPAIFILASLYISINSLVTAFGNSLKGLLIILLGLPFYLYWKAKSKTA